MDYKLSYSRPTSSYSEGLPCGNGRLGAMVIGGIKEEHILLNEESVWYGGPRDRNNLDALPNLAELRQLMLEGDISAAERLALLTLTGMPESQRHFTTLGGVVMNFNHPDGEIEKYCRSLCLSTATISTTYTLCDVDYSFEVFASSIDQVLVANIRASKPVLDFFTGIERGERVIQFSYGTHMDTVATVKNKGLIMKGNCGGEDGLKFRAACFATSDGAQRTLGDKLVFNSASCVTLYIAAGTDFNDIAIEDTCVQRCEAAINLGYDVLKNRHLQSWNELYDLASISLDKFDNINNIPELDKIFNSIRTNDWKEIDILCGENSKILINDYLIMLLFHYGRYLLASCSRDCLLPANLQGLWCRDLLPVWDGKYTTNINLQMAYWPADAANLSYCFEPYFELSKRIRENGSRTAKVMYGCNGFVVHNNTDIWADTAPQDMGLACTYWFTGGVWIAIDMWEHYRYTMDKDFLVKAWPIMRDAARFMLDYMIERDGKLVTCPSSSPENSYIGKNGVRSSFCIMPAMDIELITLLFIDCKEALKILRKEGSKLCDEMPRKDASKDVLLKGFEGEMEAALIKMEKLKIAEDGTIEEWTEDVIEVEPMHRHMSHLIGAYPYNLITEKDTLLFDAVRNSLGKRVRNGGCNNGWSRAWGAGLYARTKDGDNSKKMLIDMIMLSVQHNLLSVCNIGRVPKLLEDNLPMQIDGNSGAVLAIIEMLMQSHMNKIQLLPALPNDWQNGSFKGLVARGGTVVDASWKGGKIVSAVLRQKIDGLCSVEIGKGYGITCNGAPVITEYEDGVMTFEAAAGKTYSIYQK